MLDLDVISKADVAMYTLLYKTYNLFNKYYILTYI